MSRRRSSVIALVVIAACAAPAIQAQQLIRPGSTVRLRVAGGTTPIVGLLSSMDSDTWVVAPRDGQARRISTRDVLAAEVQVTRRHTLRGTLIGGGVGLLGGLLIVATSDDNCDNQELSGLCDTFVDISEDAVLLWAPVAGAAVGALVGTLITSRRWVPGIAPDGFGRGVTLRWSVTAGR